MRFLKAEGVAAWRFQESVDGLGGSVGAVVVEVGQQVRPRGRRVPTGVDPA